MISSGNGLRAVTKAMDMLKSGADTLDAVIAGVNILEEDPEVTTVGYGGLPNEDGVVQLDASVTHGPTRRCGAVAAIGDVKTPSKVAKLVMEQTDHVMLVGDGATQFAKDYGFQVYPITDKARTAWLVWKQSLKDPANHSNWGPGRGCSAECWARQCRCCQSNPKAKRHVSTSERRTARLGDGRSRSIRRPARSIVLR